MAIPGDFYIKHAEFQDFSNRSLDWFIRSFNYKYGSDEWKICRLKKQIYMKKALEYLKEANQCLIN